MPRICLPVNSGGESYWASQSTTHSISITGKCRFPRGSQRAALESGGPCSNFHRPSRDTDPAQVQEPLPQLKGSVSGGFSSYQEPKLKASSVPACCALLDRPLLSTQWQMACPISTLQSAWCDS